MSSEQVKAGDKQDAGGPARVGLRVGAPRGGCDRANNSASHHTHMHFHTLTCKPSLIYSHT